MTVPTTATKATTRRTVIWLIAVVVGINLTVWVASNFANEGSASGPDGSTYVTTPRGAAAVAGMLERLGTEIAQSRVPLDEYTLDPSQTLVLIDIGGSEYSAAELRQIESFMNDGGRVVVAGQAAFVERIFLNPSQWQTGGVPSATPTGDLAGAEGLVDVPLSGFGSFDVSASDSPVLAQGTTVVGLTRQVGDGDFWWFADSRPFHNDGVGNGDASVLVAVLLEGDGTVTFDEYRHGYSDQAGFWQLLSPRWRTALVLGSITALLALFAYGRRFGPAHDLHRRMPPGREEYLDAVAGILGRSRATGDALDVIRAEGRYQLRKRTGTEGEEAIAAADAGLTPTEVEALLGDGHDEETLLIADRALATLTQERK